MLLGTICYPWCVSRRSAQTSRTGRPKAQSSPMTHQHPRFSPTPFLTSETEIGQVPYRPPSPHQPLFLNAKGFWKRRRADNPLSSQDRVAKRRRECRKSRITAGENGRRQAPHLVAEPLPRARKALD